MLAVKKVHTGWLVHRVGDTSHSHYKHRSGANQLVKLYELGVMPRNAYHREAMRRVVTDEEWLNLKECGKQRYLNRRAK